MILFKLFDGGVGKNMWKQIHDLMNSCRWRGKRRHHHGDGVCHAVCAFSVVSSGRCRSSYVDKYHVITLR